MGERAGVCGSLEVAVAVRVGVEEGEEVGVGVKIGAAVPVGLSGAISKGGWPLNNPIASVPVSGMPMRNPRPQTPKASHLSLST